MDTIKIYTEDLRIAEALIKRDEAVVRQFFFQRCFPLFKSIYDNYYTDCLCVEEFINSIYLLVLAPNKETSKCQMENFKGESTLTSWLKTVCLYYCYKKFKKKEIMPPFEPLPPGIGEKENEQGDRREAAFGSIEIELSQLNREDAEKIVSLMPNKRYSLIIRMLYLEQKSTDETAEALGMTKDNLYNKHILAKKQYISTLRKEEHHG